MQYNLFLVFIFGSGILGGLITQDLWGGFLFAMVALGISGAILSFRSYYLIKSKGKTIDAYVTGTARFGYARFRPTVRFEVDGVEYESVIQLGILTHKKFYDHGTKLQIDLVLLEPIQKKNGILISKHLLALRAGNHISWEIPILGFIYLAAAVEFIRVMTILLFI